MLSAIPLALAAHALLIAGVPVAVLFGAFILIWGAHLPAPVFIALTQPKLRTLARRNRFHYLVLPVLLITFTTATSLVSGIHYAGYTDPAHPFYFNAIFILFWIYLIWNSYHFSMQSFGVLSIYRHKAESRSHVQRDLDLGFCHLNYFVLVPVSWFLAQHFLALAHYLPAVSPESSAVGRAICLTVALASTAFMVLRELVVTRSFPRLIFLLIVGFMPVMVFYSKPAFLVLYGVSHYLSSLGLTFLITSRHSPKARLGRWLLAAFVMVTPGLFIAATFRLELLTDGFLYMQRAPLFLCAVAGIRFGIAAIHFWLEGLIYRFRNPEIQASVGADLML